MKATYFFIAIFLASYGIAAAQEITVAADKRLNHDFSQYKTFHWSSQIDSKLDEGHYFLDDLVLKSQIRDAVEAELLGLGYEQDPTEPDLVVSFRVFDEPVQIKGYEGYGTGYFGDEEYRLISDTTTYDVEAGTLLISLVDREEGAMVWHGFASGLIEKDEFIKEKRTIHEAVALIFEEYHANAREYTRR